ncbi:MAG TPA: hypothetical protein VG148_14480 [Pyrinomonadaceae bacterium]|nr:hypothetical protein [Pyrinomonadaceae bacterium]
MTPADHNKVIGIMHLVYGGFFTLMAFLMLLIFGGLAGMISALAANDPNAPPAAIFWLVAGVFFFVYLVLSLPSLVAGYAMLKRKPWARVAGIVASVLAAMSLPFGTALCVYSLWFFFGDQGKAFESAGRAGPWRGSLNQGRPFGGYAQTFGHEREPAYRPPAQPPDWRSE